MRKKIWANRYESIIQYGASRNQCENQGVVFSCIRTTCVFTHTVPSAHSPRAFYAHWIFDSSVLSTMSNVRNPRYSIGRSCVSFILGFWEGQFVSRRGRWNDKLVKSFRGVSLDFLSTFLLICQDGFITSGFTWKKSRVRGFLCKRLNQKEMMTLSFLYALCMWMSLVCCSLGTGYVYRFPGITVQRQRIKSEQSSNTGPPGTGSSTQLRWSRMQSVDS